MKIIVLGAGIIGVTTAYYLARNGHEVMVIDRSDTCALGCSFANGGQLSYSHVETWSKKSSLFSLYKELIKPNSYLTVPKILDKNFLKWFYEFSCNSKNTIANKSSENLYNLGIFSKDCLEEIVVRENIKFSYKKDGILHFYRNKKLFDLAIKEIEELEFIGRNIQILNAEECLKKEPTLIKLFDEKKLVGGIFYEEDQSGNSFLFAKQLQEICSQKYGVNFKYGVEIRNIFTNHKKITGVNTSDGVFVADKYVYALGALGIKLLSGIDIDSKIYPVKGYSLSIKCDDEFLAPKMSLTDPENKIVYSRLDNIFRIAGTIEICGHKNSFNKKNLNFLKNKTFATFSDCGNLNDIKEWCGFRPFRSNSIPLICEVKKYGNLFLNTGHGSLGWTLSCGSSKIIADLISMQKYDQFSFLDNQLK